MKWKVMINKNAGTDISFIMIYRPDLPALYIEELLDGA
jgi:hypothetical protein